MGDQVNAPEALARLVHKGPREDWFCSCTEGNGAILRPGSLDRCEACGVIAPFIEYRGG